MPSQPVVQAAAQASKVRPATGAAQPGERIAPPTYSIPLGLRIVRVLAVSVVSSILILATLPIWRPAGPIVLPSLAPAGYLMLARAGGFVAYALLWLSMALGVSISSKLSRIWPGGPAAADVHRYVSLLGVSFTLIHVLTLLGDAALGYTLGKGLLPFAGSSYRPFWMGLLGKIGFYTMALVALSFYIRARLGHRLWRLIHYLSFVSFVLSLVHALSAGTDSAAPWAIGLYGASVAVLLGLTAHRLRQARRARRQPATPRRSAAAP